MVPSPTVCEVVIPFSDVSLSNVEGGDHSFQIISAYGSLPDTAKMVIPTKIFSTSVVEIKVTQGSLIIHAKAVTIPGSFISV